MTNLATHINMKGGFDTSLDGRLKKKRVRIGDCSSFDF